MKKTAKSIGFLVTGILSLSCIFGGCAPQGGDSGESAGGGFTVIRFWNGFTGADGETMDKIVSNFNAAYADEKIMVVADKLPWDTLFNKITTTSSNLKTAPHIVAMSASRIAGMEAKKILLPLEGIEEYLSVSESDYISAAWNGGVLGDVRYGFPLDVHPTAMYYNKNLIAEEELPSTWDEFLDVCIEKTKDGVYGWTVPSMYSVTKDVFLNMLYSAGGSMFDNGNKAVFNSSVAEEKLQYLYDLVHGENPVSPENVGSGGDFTLFSQGKSVFYFDGPWVINTFGLFDNPDSNIGVASCPDSLGEGQLNFAGSHQFTLMKNTVTTDTVRNACYTFMKYVSDHSLDWGKAGQVPAKKSIHETAEYKSLAALQPFTQMAYNSTLGEIDYKYWYEAYNNMGVAVSNAISDISKPRDALNAAVSDFNDFVIDQEL